MRFIICCHVNSLIRIALSLFLSFYRCTYCTSETIIETDPIRTAIREVGLCGDARRGRY